jgi:hypothetical protein
MMNFPSRSYFTRTRLSLVNHGSKNRDGLKSQNLAYSKF